MHESEAAISVFSGNSVPPGTQPLALAYAGHQFGHFTMLGDGRALLLGEHVTPEGIRLDIQLKGSGPTPYSRRGDGRAALAPMLREYLISEAMNALGVPTTLSLAVVTFDEPVYRQRALPGAILTRVASSHIRVGTFQFAALQGTDSLKALADYTISRHDPDLYDLPNPYLGLLSRVIKRQASLIASWMLLGFVHGVMNTDNVSISGETIDYGPCAFMDRYDPATVFSSIDRQGRYAYGNQPAMGQWNLCRFAESLLPLLDSDEDRALNLAQDAIKEFSDQYENSWRSGLAHKLGFKIRSDVIDRLSEEFLQLLQITRADFTNSFRALMCQKIEDESFVLWQRRWHKLIEEQPGGLQAAQELMAQRNPVVIPRNHLVQAALEAAEQGDFEPFELLYSVLQSPFSARHQETHYALPPDKDLPPYVTYCGT